MQHNRSLSDIRGEWPLTSAYPFGGYWISLACQTYVTLFSPLSEPLFGFNDFVVIKPCEFVSLPVRATTARRLPQRCIRQFPAELAKTLDPPPTMNVMIMNQPYSHHFCIRLCHAKQWNGTYGCIPWELSKYFRYPATGCKDNVMENNSGFPTINHTDCGCRPACEHKEFEMLGIDRWNIGTSFLIEFIKFDLYSVFSSSHFFNSQDARNARFMMSFQPSVRIWNVEFRKR